MLEQLRYDVKHAVRGLLRDRAFTAIALLSIGLGVGANSAIFSLVHQALLRQLPVPEPERLVLLSWNGGVGGNRGGRRDQLPPPEIRGPKDQNHGVRGLSAPPPPPSS